MMPLGLLNVLAEEEEILDLLMDLLSEGSCEFGSVP